MRKKSKNLILEIVGAGIKKPKRKAHKNLNMSGLTPFKKGCKPPNPSGKNGSENRRALTAAYKIVLDQRANPVVSAALGLPKSARWVDCIATGLAHRASISDTTAAKELREGTEGRLPESVNLAGTIDYSAGKDAKEILTSKLKKK